MDLLATPSWAYSFCYYYAFVAAIVVVSSVYSLFQIFMLPAPAKKLLPITSMSITMILSALVAVVLTMMQFWICRGALKPKEAFAVKCDQSKGTGDCTDVMGTPQGPACSCGGRGFCAGCTMHTNTNPDELEGVE